MNELSLANVNHSIEFIENIVKIVKQSKYNVYNQNRKPYCVLGRSLYNSNECWDITQHEAFCNIINRHLTIDEYYDAILGKRSDSYNDAEWIAINLFGVGVAPNFERGLAERNYKMYKITKHEWLEKAEYALAFLYETSKNIHYSTVQ